MREPGAEAFWPTEGQEALLRAGLLDGRRALEAWDTWKARHDLVGSDHDLGSFRLLPLVYKNLVAHGADDPLLPRLKGIYRFAWCGNQRLLHAAARLLDELSTAGIRTMVLKGAALATLYYRDRGARPMFDVDVLVPARQAVPALECLARAGWQAVSDWLNEDLRFRHATTLRDGRGLECDLHWHAFYECLQENADDDLWSRAVPTDLLDVPTLALDPTDTLFHTVVHGMRWDEVPTVRWIPDALMVLRQAGPEIAWDRVLDEAEERRLLLRFGRGIRYLHDTFEAPVPDEVLRRLDARRPSYLERVEYRYLALGPEEQKGVVLGYYPFLLLDYLRFAAGQSPFRKLMGLPEYLRYRFMLPSRAQLPRLVLGHAVRKARRMVAGRRVTRPSP